MDQDNAMTRDDRYTNSPDRDHGSTTDDALRRDMDDSRRRISATVTEIEHRVRPGYVMARRRERVRRRLTDWKDSVFGNDEPEYPTYRSRGYGYGSSSGSAPYAAAPYQTGYDGGEDGGESGALERGRQRGADAAHAMTEAPQAIRRQTRGNPLAAGAVAVGAGWLLASLMPETRRERELATRAEPELARAAGAARTEMEEAAHSVGDSARDAAEHVKDAGRDATESVKDQAKEGAGSVRRSS